MPQPISSSLMSRYVLIAEDSQSFHHSKMKKCEVDLKEDAVAKQENQGFSLGLRKFRNLSENFAILVKFC